MEPGKPERFQTVDEYISAQPEEVAIQLQALRAAVCEAAPNSVEVISYNMPAIKQNGIVVYYAAHTKHIGFYPGAAAVNLVFAEQLAGFETSKGTVRFPMENPIPVELVKEIVAYRVQENERKKRKA